MRLFYLLLIKIVEIFYKYLVESLMVLITFFFFINHCRSLSLTRQITSACSLSCMRGDLRLRTI
jgi:hypothetical protein